MKLQEAKEKLPLSFLTDFISRGWDEVGVLKADIEAIKEAYSGTAKVEELLQTLADAYLVCIGQIELFMESKEYLEFPEEPKEEAKNESLKEELIKEADEEQEEPSEEESAEAAIEVLKDKVDIHGEDDMLIIAEKGQLDNPEAPKVETEINEEEFDVLAQEFHTEEPEDKEETKEIGEGFEYFCDFDEPTGEAITDAELYPEEK